MQLQRPQNLWPLRGWDPLNELEDLTTRFNRIFGGTRWPIEREQESLALTDWAPAVDVSEKDGTYLIRAELPEVRRDDVHITLEDGVLTIQGDRREPKEDKGVRFHRRELSYGHFVRRFTMPDDVEPTKIDAKFENGMLNLVIPRTAARPSNVREIAIK